MRIPGLRVNARRRGLAVVAAAIVWAGCAAPATEPTHVPTGSASATSTSTARATPTPSASLPIPDPSAAAGWTAVAALGDGEGWDLAHSVARGADAFVAVGVRYERAVEVIFARPRDYLWISDDGRTWEEVPMGAAFAGATLSDVTATPDGGFVVLGTRELTPVAWQSADGRTWQEFDTNLDPDLMVYDVVGGARGYLLSAEASLTSDRSLWHSLDGVTWEEVRHFPADDSSVGPISAGAEGFVALGSRPGSDGGPEATVFASADGMTWLEAPQAFGLDDVACTAPLLAPLGGDWIVVSAMPDDSPMVWHSVNGLDWESVGSIENVTIPACGESALTSAAGTLLFSPSVAFHSLSSEVWSSPDGREWEPWEPGVDAAVLAAVDSPAGAVAVGAAVQSADSSLASFWFAR